MGPQGLMGGNGMLAPQGLGGSRMLGPRGLRVFQMVCSPLFTWACMHGEKGFSMTCEQGETTFLHFV